PHHCAPLLRGLPFSEFIRAQWWCVWDEQATIPKEHPGYLDEMMQERDPETNERFANILQVRTAKNHNWFNLGRKVRHYVPVRYEDAKADPESLVAVISERFGI